MSGKLLNRLCASAHLTGKSVLQAFGISCKVTSDIAIAELPLDFQADVYLELNPDLRVAGVDPSMHFLSNGRFENRLYALPKLQISGGIGFNSCLETILIVSHEASRTGAPILALNLVQALAVRYNIVVLLLGGGPLIREFSRAGSIVFIEAFSRFNPFVARHVIREICSQYQIRFGLVNSIESRNVLQGLAEHGIPSVSLVHEFASYTRPLVAFRDTFNWASSVVFSADVTRDNAFSLYPGLAEKPVFVHPQGKCILPKSPEHVLSNGDDMSRLVASMRQQQDLPNTFVVLGAGAIHFRKGVDLFVDCACRFKRRAEGRPFRFVWIGSGYDPDGDVDYSSYLSDQIDRAGLSENVVFVGETSFIESAYSNADVFFLSSRLDPLPNVAIDAMFHGVPVVCFDRCSGIADFLHSIEMAPRCVASYLDTDDAAVKLLEFAAADALKTKTGETVRAAAFSHFDMARYVEQIESVASTAVSAHVKPYAPTVEVG